MGTQKRSKLNHLLHDWPRGTVYTTQWLKRHGYSRFLLTKYKKGNWTYSIGHGAVARGGDKPDWTGGLYALQKQLHLKVHVGSKTALHQSGYGHFLPLGRLSVELFGLPGTKLPTWFREYDWGVDIKFQTRKLFADYVTGQTDRNLGTFFIKSSTPERAALELLDGVPSKQTYDEARLIFENLTTLRSHLVQSLLEKCASIKAKRLFLHLAEEFSHPWFSKLNVSKIKLGKGKRSIVSKGYLNAKYQIVIPRNA